ncbi:hypothetical protein [Paenibacillus sp. GCM10012306]|uniref:DUF6414 family protein n=1 Tax=Paenibacillus sp. GCM10012306 TaxID=3317342 RepID=UPI00361856E1
MFGTILYLNKKLINEFRAIATKLPNVKQENTKVTTERSASGKASLLSASAKSTESYDAIIEENLLLECRNFEKTLTDNQYYHDYVESEEFNDISTESQGTIVKFKGYISVPEAFDLTQLIIQMKPMLLDSISRDMEPTEQEAFRTFFSKKDAKVPLLIESDDALLCSKIESQYLEVEYAELEDSDAIEVTVLAKVNSNSLVPKSKALFDPLKDFIPLNRTMRRSMEKDRPRELQAIWVDQDYKSVDIIAMYR